MTSPSTGGDGTLSLTISPYGYIEWRGPRAWLEAIGVVPAHIKWPERIAWAQWHAQGFEFALRRCRPDGLKGPMRGWMNCDFWFVRRTVLRPMDDMSTIHGSHRELGDLLFDAARSGEALGIHFSKVHPDKRIEKFKAQFVFPAR